MCREQRRANPLLLMLLLWLGQSSIAWADSSPANPLTRLHQEIEAQRSQVRLLHERIVKDYNEMFTAPWRSRPYPPNPAAPAIEITDLETWWDSDPRGGLAPTFRFRLHNIGSKPITNLYLTCTYFLASGTKFGSGDDLLVPNVVQIIPPGHWMTVLNSWNKYSRLREVFGPLTVQAEIELSPVGRPHGFVRRITIPPKPQRLPSEASLR